MLNIMGPETKFPVTTTVELDYHSPLFLAHESGKKADIYLKYSDFKRAIECHRTAIELLQEAMTLTNFASTQESLQLQKNHHYNQTKIIKVQQLVDFKKNQLQPKKTVNNRKMSEIDEKERFLQWPILRTSRKIEKLIKALRERPEPRKPPFCLATKKPDREDLIEELEMAHAELQTLTNQLLNEVDKMREKMDQLQSKVDFFEQNSLL